MKFTATLALVAAAASAAEFSGIDAFFAENDDFGSQARQAQGKSDSENWNARARQGGYASRPAAASYSAKSYGGSRGGYYRQATVPKQVVRKTKPVSKIAVDPARAKAAAYKVAAAPVSYGGASYYRGDSLLYSGDSQPTYTYKKGKGYGIYSMPRRTKALIANDGYRVKRRSRVGERLSETVNAKCVLMDPDYKSEVYGVFKLSQGVKDQGTLIWADVDGLYKEGKYELSINALGDLRDGCDSTGDVFNPFVSKSGYGHWKEPETAPGALGSIKNGQIDIKADVDLSGTHSIIGRSIVITSSDSADSYGKAVEGRREGCCTIGLAAADKPVYKPVAYKTPAYQAPYQPYQGHNYGGW